MKNLLRLCRVPFGLLVLAQCLVGCILSLLPHYNTTRNMLLFVALPYAGMGATLWLTHRLVGLVGVRREQMAARFPGPRWQLEVLRVLLPLVCVLLPSLFLVAWADCGAYWAVQRAWHGAPLLPHAARYTACTFLPCVLGVWTAMTIFMSGGALANSYARSNQIGWVSQVILLTAGVVAFGASVMHFESYKMVRMDAVMIIAMMLWPTCVLVYALVLRPQRPASLRLGALLRHVIFVALCIMVVPALADKLLSVEIDWWHIGLMLVLAVVSWYRLGWLAALLALPCGLNLWWALGWLLCLPDSVMVRCTACRVRTHSWRSCCPGCAAPLRYQVIVPPVVWLARMRTAAVVTIAMVMLVIVALSYIIPTAALRKAKDTPAPRQVRVVCLAPYPMTNVVVAYDGRVLGTNQVTLAERFCKDKLRLNDWLTPLNRMTFSWNGSALDYSILGYERSGWRRRGTLTYPCFVRPPQASTAARQLRKKLGLAEYAWARCQDDPQGKNEAVLLELLRNIPDEKNLRLKHCVTELFSNYWHALLPDQQLERIKFYTARWRCAPAALTAGAPLANDFIARVRIAIMHAAPRSAIVKLQPSWNIFQQHWPAYIVQAALNPFIQGFTSIYALRSDVPEAQDVARWCLARQPLYFTFVGAFGDSRGNDIPDTSYLLPYYRRAAAQAQAPEHTKDYHASCVAYSLVRGLNSAPLTAEDEALLQKFSVATNRFSSWPVLVGLDTPVVWHALQRQGCAAIQRPCWPGFSMPLYQFESVWPPQFTATNIAACLRALAASTPKPADNAWLVAVLCHWPASDATLAALLQLRIESALDAALRCGGVNRDTVVRTLVQQACRQGDAKIAAAAKKIYETPHGDAVACLDLLAAASSTTLHETIVRYRAELAALQDELR